MYPGSVGGNPMAGVDGNSLDQASKGPYIPVDISKYIERDIVGTWIIVVVTTKI